MIQKQLYSVFEKTYFVNDKWITVLSFYYGDLSNVDLKTDWRFKEVPNKRKQNVFLGLVELTNEDNKNPFLFPMTLKNGKVINNPNIQIT
jgi:hypothetical protein